MSSIAREEEMIREDQASIDYVRPVIAEFAGTFCFIFIGAGSIVANQMTHGALGPLGIALAHGLGLAVMICIFGATSGAHFNPAVTIGLAVTNHIKPALALLYIIAQLVGATLSGLALRVMFPQSVWEAAQLGTPMLGTGVSAGLGVFVEALLTFFLVLAVFGTAVDERAPKIGGFGIGLTLMVSILVGGSISGASLNPARTFGPALAGGFWTNDLVYWIGPIAGAIIAALLYQYVILPRKNQ